ncbi:MAG: hypothetical protein NZM43_11775 [Saprospiraceae bacterium]|nr:hypothetical protein [Saprospiraceae bacterium]MDW8484988.1 hypothetical protein [Saprospiraceae bacterium]
MTLGEFMRAVSDDPVPATLYFFALPTLALLTNWVTGKAAYAAPWKYFYALLVYAACIPGIFATCLSIYLFLFQPGGNIFNLNLITQVLPILSMILTLAIIRQHIAFTWIPGFRKLSNLILSLSVIFLLMYLLDRMRLVAFVYMPVQYLLLIVVGALLLLNYSFRQLLR